jgi:ATP-dependent Clp protease ATP-binding subunit ClpB
MTSNIGAHIISGNFEGINELNRDEIIARTRLQVMDLLKKSIRPEFLNRIDEIIMFNPLTRDEIEDIVKIQFNAVAQRLKNNGITITIEPKAAEWLAELGYDPQFGARPLKRIIQKKIMNELSKEILAGRINREVEIIISLNGKKEFLFKNNKAKLEAI